LEKLLIIDDDESIRESLKLVLSQSGYAIFIAANAEIGLEIVEKAHPDLIISDLKLPGMDGIELLNKVKNIDWNIPYIVITAYEETTTTIQAIQQGAYDYIEKPLDIEKLKIIIKRALEEKKISEHLSITISKDSDEYSLENSLIGKTPAMKEILKKIGKVSSNRVSILIQGESGTGKELITKVIHYSGITKTKPFIAVNCTALSETLLESELFGHVKGAFTGAIKDKKGKFELADEGTIFLDEISEISPNLQVKLLRVLQEKEFEKVGGEITIPMNARIVTATNRKLSEYIKAGKFREDLYYRLKVFTIDMPPLRERREDIPNLVIHLLKKINKDLHKEVRKVPIEVMEMLQNYEWIGNVRELENTLLQAVVLTEGDVLKSDNILLRNVDWQKKEMEKKENLSLDEIVNEHIRVVLNQVYWNKTKACNILKISKPTLDKKIKELNLELPKAK
jgi:two-component system response regulator AtoC